VFCHASSMSCVRFLTCMLGTEGTWLDLYSGLLMCATRPRIDVPPMKYHGLWAVMSQPFNIFSFAGR
jgi:hypothetical protein